MLTRRMAVLVVITMSVLGLGVPAGADPPGGSCPPREPDCTVTGGLPGGPGSPGGSGGGGGSSGGSRTCTREGKTVPCFIAGVGSFNPADGCYYQLAQPQGPSPDGTPGAWYQVTCLLADGSIAARTAWLTNPPPGLGPTPEELAQQALAKIRLLGAQIGVAPTPNGAGLVGLPVWLWTAVNPNTWGPISASASAAGLTVTITGHATRIVWQMGDGGNVTCTNPGTPYLPSYGLQSSPTCGYKYPTPSTSRAEPHGRYTIIATTFWRVDWSGGGVSGVIDTTRQSQTTLEIQEMQVLTS